MVKNLSLVLAVSSSLALAGCMSGMSQQDQAIATTAVVSGLAGVALGTLVTKSHHKHRYKHHYKHRHHVAPSTNYYYQPHHKYYYKTNKNKLLLQ